jgi:hypothetical protein
MGNWLAGSENWCLEGIEGGDGLDETKQLLIASSRFCKKGPRGIEYTFLVQRQ